MPLPAGLLREWVTLQRAVEETSESGQVVKQWLDVAVVPARVEPLGGREQFGQQQWVATGDTRFTIRYLAEVNPLLRVVHRGLPYEIVSSSPDAALETTLIVGRVRPEER
jgi:SPP1 family predicted phage head-tail adaptor